MEAQPSEAVTRGAPTRGGALSLGGGVGWGTPGMGLSENVLLPSWGRRACVVRASAGNAISSCLTRLTF